MSDQCPCGKIHKREKELQVAGDNHVVEAVGPRPGFLAEAVGNPAGNAAASWLFVFFLVNHFENLSFFWLITSKI